MAVQVSQVSKTSDFTTQFSGAQKAQKADGSNFMTFLKDARKVIKNNQDSHQTDDQLSGDDVLENAQATETTLPPADLLVDEATLEMPGLLNPDQNDSDQDQTTELLTALLMGGLVAPENVDQTVAVQAGQEVSTEMLTGAVQNSGSEPILLADQGQQLAETPALVEAAFSDDLVSQFESSSGEQASELLSLRNLKDVSGSRQVNELTDTTTDAARTDQPVGRMSETTVGIQGSTDEASKTISLNGSGLQEETAEAPSAEADGKQLDVQSLLGVKTAIPETKAEPAQVLSQVQDAIIENFETNTDKTFKVTLNPESLGEIDVEMEFSNGKLTINILAASQETHELLTKQIDQLVRGLALQKISVETVTVNRAVEETADSGEQAQSSMTNMDFRQGQQQESQSNLIQGKFNRMGRIGLTSGESLDESLTDLTNISAQSSRFSRLNYLV
ncbi:MAG: flagellar hook-length control protein FliK [Eubacteriaceae bacterium]|jgi:flagellar hook-length control protein FliK|nr:flagellar hook-length control protein FliK [Eubacteriaceae bacterium]